MSGTPLDPLIHLLTSLAIAIGVAAVATVSIVMFLRWLGLHWSWALPGVLLGPALWSFDQKAAGFAAATALFATATGARWHREDLTMGGEHAQRSRDRRTMFDVTRTRVERRGVRGGRWLDRRGLAVGRDERGRTVRIPVGHRSGRHALVVGATGSGKTVTQAWIAGRLIRAGQGAVVIDPKGDQLLREELEHAARQARRPFRLWTPEGPAVYNPFAHGTDTELADKVLAGGNLHRAALPAPGAAVPRPRRAHPAWHPNAGHRRHAGRGNGARHARVVQPLAAPRAGGQAHPRLRRLAVGRAAPRTGRHPRPARDPGRIRRRKLPVAREADAPQHRPARRRAPPRRRPVPPRRRPPTTAGRNARRGHRPDLLTIAAELQHQPVPTLVLVDEFSAVAPTGVVRLFGRGRSAGLSLLLGTQELADLRPPDNTSLADQVLGNLTTLIAHRQVVPQSAETLAGVMGTRGAWAHTERTETFLGAGVPSGEGTRTREFVVRPDTIKRLPTGRAAVTSPGHGQPRIARMNHPEDAR